MEKKNLRSKTVRLKTEHWRELRQLAINQDMTLQAEVDQIIGSFLDCVEESKEDRRK